MTVTKSRRIINVYKVFVRKPDGKRSLWDRSIDGRATYGSYECGAAD